MRLAGNCRLANVLLPGHAHSLSVSYCMQDVAQRCGNSGEWSYSIGLKSHHVHYMVKLLGFQSTAAYCMLQVATVCVLVGTSRNHSEYEMERCQVVIVW
jgi:hypothetical protein